MHDGRCKAPKSPDCPESCSIDFKFVCGSDGTTYVNRCIMQKMNCQEGTDIAVAHDGACAGDPVTNLMARLAENNFPPHLMAKLASMQKVRKFEPQLG